MSEPEKALHLAELIVENVKKVKRIVIRPVGHTFVIGGDNEQGKTSLLDAIEMLIAGARSVPAQPIRHGASSARVIGDFEEFVVERRFSEKGTTLEIRSKDGSKIASPQTLLDKFCNKLTVDPLAFSKMDPKDQDALLKRLIPELDCSDIEIARVEKEVLRTAANKEVKRLTALLESKPLHKDAPKELVSVAELTAELQRRNAANKERDKQKATIDVHRQSVDGLAREIARARAEIARLEGEIKQYELDRETRLAGILKAERDLPPEESVTETEERLTTAEAVNTKVRANAEREKIQAELFKQRDAVDAAKTAIEKLDGEKAARLTDAKFPVQGLGFDQDGPTLDGVPFAQASEARRIRASVAISAAMHPNIRIQLIREGSALGKKAMALLDEIARETNSQFFIERVSETGEGCNILIEDGMIVDEPTAAVAAAE